MRLPSRSALVVAPLVSLTLFGACQQQAAVPAPAHQPATAKVAATAAVTAQVPAVPVAPGELTAPSPKLGEELPSLAPLVETVKSVVVNVEVQARVENTSYFGFSGRRSAPEVRQGSGSGFIIDPNGLVLTNNHVVDDAVAIKVKLDDGRSFEASVLGRDPLTDVALLKLEGVKEPLPAAKLGDSDAMKVGDYVVAIGNPFGLASSVSSGIISARARNIQAGPYDDFLQTDAAINPGNSGGPLFNLRGEVIGMNTAIIGGGTGIGFAVPMNMAKFLLPQLEQGEVHRGWLGVGIQDLSPELAQAMNVPAKGGAVVLQVTEGTPAQKAGLQQDDVVVALDGEPVESTRDLTHKVGFRKPGSTVTLTAYRGAEKREFKVELGERPNFEGVSTGGGGSNATRDAERAERLGLMVRDVDPRMFDRRGGPDAGAVIVKVNPGSPADDAGLRPGMVVVEAGGKRIASGRELARVLSNAPSGESVLLRVDHGGGRALRALRIP